MPYIKQAFRKANNPLVVCTYWHDMAPDDERRARLIRPIALDTAGELNFAITVLASEYVRRRGVSYTVLNEVMGVFASAQSEFYRRVVAPYEDKKCEENGEVYDCTIDLLMAIKESQPPTQETDDAEPDK